MKRAAVPSILVVVILLAVAIIAEAQQPTKVHRIAYLTVAPLSANVPSSVPFSKEPMRW
jgi:hypothetical protein